MFAAVHRCYLLALTLWAGDRCEGASNMGRHGGSAWQLLDVPGGGLLSYCDHCCRVTELCSSWGIVAFLGHSDPTQVRGKRISS